MIKLFMIADDLTGALDAGIKFTQKGLRTLVIPDPKNLQMRIREESDVVVVCSNTRAMPSAEAYATVYQIGRIALQYDPDIIYKKIDSALRGNIGSELAALADLLPEETVSLVPAYPAMGRVTCGGIHYIDGQPLAESVFADDPITPMESSYIPDILARQTKQKVNVITGGMPIDNSIFQSKGCINLFDAQYQTDLAEIATQLKMRNRLRLLAGCAGFAEEIANLISQRGSEQPTLPNLECAIVICGSLNKITVAQIQYAAENGAANYHLSEEAKRDPHYWLQPKGKAEAVAYAQEAHERLVVLDTVHFSNMEVRSEDGNAHQTIAASLGMLTKQLIQLEENCLFLLTGGDTLAGFIDQLEEEVLEPVCELIEGVVLFRVLWNGKPIYILSKSGGFCKESIFLDVFNRLISSEHPARLTRSTRRAI